MTENPTTFVAAALGALWLLLLAAAPAGAQSAFFDEGNRLYQAGDFEGALDRYRRILDEELESGELYYNIGNAHFRLGALAPAILNYERARRLMPGDDDLLANLALARWMTADDITPRPRFWLFRAAGWWVGLLPRAALIWLVALAWLTAVAGAAVVVLRPGPGLAAWARRAGRRRRGRGPRLRRQPRRPRAPPRRRRGGHRDGRGGPGAERALGRSGPADLRRPRRHQGRGGPPG